jgi:hypothetical protein
MQAQSPLLTIWFLVRNFLSFLFLFAVILLIFPPFLPLFFLLFLLFSFYLPFEKGLSGKILDIPEEFTHRTILTVARPFWPEKSLERNVLPLLLIF